MRTVHCSARCLVAMALLWGTDTRAADVAVTLTPEQVVAKSIAYHDPNGVWETGRVRLEVRTTLSEAYAQKTGGKDSKVSLLLAPGHEEFEYSKDTGDDKVEIILRRGVGTVAANGITKVSDDERERLRIREPEMYRDYCEYLYGMPMKLKDPGTVFGPDVESVKFNDRAVWQLRVTYQPDVGEDIWYFYFDEDTFALVGYQFFHDESKPDGEYITLVGEIVDEASGLRLPSVRSWYYNADDGHLATDDIVSISTSD